MEQRKQRDEMKVPGKSHIRCSKYSHPNWLLPGIFCSTVAMRFHWRAWIFHLGPTRGCIGSLNLFWGQTSQVKLEFGKYVFLLSEVP